MALLAMSRMPDPPHHLCSISTQTKLKEINAKTPQFMIYIFVLFIIHLLCLEKISRTKLNEVGTYQSNKYYI